jgi:predicted tellurium resistance membrane protein TerC
MTVLYMYFILYFSVQFLLFIYGLFKEFLNISDYITLIEGAILKFSGRGLIKDVIVQKDQTVPKRRRVQIYVTVNVKQTRRNLALYCLTE